MQVYSDGQSRVIKADFPKRFKLYNAGVPVSYLRTGKDSIRLSGKIPVGVLDVEEVIKEKAVKPARLDTSTLAIVNKEDFERIDVLSKVIANNQERIGNEIVKLSEKDNALESSSIQNAESIQKAQENIVEMAKAFGKEIQADRDSLIKTADSINSSIKQTGDILSSKIEAHEKAKNPHKITKATLGLERVDNTPDEEKPISKAVKKALDEKADKSEIDNVKKDIEKAVKGQDKIVKGIERMNMVGGVGGNELPTGGKKDQVLTKNSNKTGDYSWKDSGGLPDQSGQSGKYLTTNGTVASWGSIDLSGYVPTSRTINGKALTSNISLTSDDITYPEIGTNCTYVFDLFVTVMESLGESVGGNFDVEGTFVKSSYKTSESIPLNNITDRYDMSYAVGWCDRAIGKISSLTTTVKTDCVSAINEINGIIGDIETALHTINSGV